MYFKGIAMKRRIRKEIPSRSATKRNDFSEFIVMIKKKTLSFERAF
jgi:hypothetical protein